MSVLPSPFWRLRRAIRNAFYNLKYRVQRFIRGYSDLEVFDLSGRFIEIMTPILTELRKTHHGYPCGLTNEEWEQKLDEMIRHLKYMNDSAETHVAIAKELGFENCEIGRMSLDEIHRIYEYIQNESDEFFRLFARHFFDLWD